MKICSLRDELFIADIQIDGQTYRHQIGEVISFANTPNILMDMFIGLVTHLPVSSFNATFFIRLYSGPMQITVYC